MKLKINPQAPVPIYAQLIEQIRNAILSGVLEVGSALPSVRQLADELEINSLTIQKTYKQLEAAELIVIKKGVGAFVRDDIKQMSKREKDSRIAEELRPVVLYAQELRLSKDLFLNSAEKIWEENHD